MAEIAQALVGLRQELKKDIADGLSREMTALRTEIRGITVDASQDQTMAEDIRGDLQRLSDSINQLGRQASPSQADALKVEFDELRVMIDGLAREDSVHRMEARWTGVEDRMNAFDSNRDDELVALAYRLDEIKSQIGSMNSGPAIHALEDKLVAVAQAIEMIGRHMQPDDRHMVSQFADLDARLDEISRAIVASGRAAVPDSAGVTRVEGRLADLSRQIDGPATAGRQWRRFAHRSFGCTGRGTGQRGSGGSPRGAPGTAVADAGAFAEGIRAAGPYRISVRHFPQDRCDRPGLAQRCACRASGRSRPPHRPARCAADVLCRRCPFRPAGRPAVGYRHSSRRNARGAL